MGSTASQPRETRTSQAKTYALGVLGMQGSPWSSPQQEGIQCGNSDHNAGDGWEDNGSSELPAEVVVPLHHNHPCNNTTKKNDEHCNKIHSAVAERWMLRNQTELGKIGVSKMARFLKLQNKEQIFSAIWVKCDNNIDGSQLFPFRGYSSLKSKYFLHCNRNNKV